MRSVWSSHGVEAELARLDASEAGTGTFWQEKSEHATGPPGRPARQDRGRLADPFDWARRHGTLGWLLLSPAGRQWVATCCWRRRSWPAFMVYEVFKALRRSG
jgi:hypothetical protein